MKSIAHQSVVEKFTIFVFVLGVAITPSTQSYAADKEPVTDAPTNVVPSDGARKYLKAYPKPEKDQVRYVIWLPHKTRAEEGNWRVELITGRIMETDGVNTYRLSGGELESVNIQGWGFTYYKAKPFGKTAQTLIGGSKQRVLEFVRATSQITRYNSRLPIVVIGPKDLEVHYRIFQSSQTYRAAAE
jgi:ecotin